MSNCEQMHPFLSLSVHTHILIYKRRHPSLQTFTHKHIHKHIYKHVQTHTKIQTFASPCNFNLTLERHVMVLHGKTEGCRYLTFCQRKVNFYSILFKHDQTQKLMIYVEYNNEIRNLVLNAHF
jgi:hypothetical protein